MAYRVLVLLSVLVNILACPDHNIRLHEHGVEARAKKSRHWGYDASYNWGSINESYTLCQTGTQQSPIPLWHTKDLSRNLGQLRFDYPNSTHGMLFNWGYGASFTINATSDSLSSWPSISFDDETAYLKGWHTHAPSDHRVQGQQSKAELHLVHAKAEGHERAVISIRINAGEKPSSFFAQFPEFPSFDRKVTREMEIDILQAVKEANMFSRFWTYRGSLTSPPCTEGIRWFIARDVLLTSVAQMQELLRVSTYSARVEQEVWQHYVSS